MLLALTLIFTLSISTGQVSPLTFQSLPRSLHRMPSVRLRIQLTGANMQIHGQSVFDVFANPILSAAENSLHYDGFAHFIQEDYQFTYVFVNGIGYVVESKGNETTSVASQTTRRLSSISPFDDIIAALNNLTAISSESVGDDSLVDCPNGGTVALLHISFSCRPPISQLISITTCIAECDSFSRFFTDFHSVGV
ncbi:hypothetical protein F443_00361 [Phytophthora nicotianae P1569]|uniref:Uncharacterized protein n=2 Tax=Phytophthora nicotianae TaxID=4792 RepID=V9G0S9_PHYNI|nr:hypothetical protein F443_00361 [Phytophthora nicotianae P1569]